jgi:ferredoxin-type protein NapH
MLQTAELRAAADDEEEKRDRVPEGATPRKWRKQKLAAVKKRRKAKQLIMGSFFIILLGAGWVFPLVGYFIPLCMVAGVGTAFFKGRSWCNWYCPRGSFADAYMRMVSPGRAIPGVMRGKGLRVAVLAFLMAMLFVQIIRLWPDFYAIGRFFVILLTVTTVAGIILALIFHQRAWCYVCPIGSMSSWVGKGKQPLTLSREECTHCRLCGKECPMQLSPYDLREGTMAGRQDCLKCGVCVESCPKGALRFGRSIP